MKDFQKDFALKLYQRFYGRVPQKDGLFYVGVFKHLYVYTHSEKEFVSFIKVQKKLSLILKVILTAIYCLIVLLISIPFVIKYFSIAAMLGPIALMVVICLGTAYLVSLFDKQVKLLEKSYFNQIRVLETKAKKEEA